MLPTSGFVADVMFSHSAGPMARHAIEKLAVEHGSRDSHQILISTIVSCAPGAKSVIYGCLVD